MRGVAIIAVKPDRDLHQSDIKKKKLISLILLYEMFQSLKVPSHRTNKNPMSVSYIPIGPQYLQGTKKKISNIRPFFFHRISNRTTIFVYFVVDNTLVCNLKGEFLT